MSENIVGAANADPIRLLEMMTGYWVSKSVYVVAKLGIPDALADGPKHVDELAMMSGANGAALYRVLRALASVHLFSEVEPGRFAVTATGALLQTAAPRSMRPLAIMYGEEQYQAWGDLLHSVRTGQTAFDHQFGMGIFEYFGGNPEASAVFNAAMTSWTVQLANAVVAAYDFSPFGVVVDVGGNRGTLLAAVLNARPAAKGVLFDLPHVAAGAKESLTAEGVIGRCEIVGGDFFRDALPKGDAVMLAQIIHDWDDERCIQILSRCRAAIVPGGKLLVVELVLPEGDAPSFGKWLDLHMLVLTGGGRERTSEQFRQLLKAGGFKLTRIVPTAAGTCVVEAEPI